MYKFFAAAIAMTVSAASAGGRISDFQWKNRLLVASGASAELVDKINSAKAGMFDRDLKVFVLSGAGVERFPVGKDLSKEFVSRLNTNEDRPMVYLIGKDGKTTLNWPLDEFTIEKLFANIDAMPMRKREMREKR